MGYFNVKVGTSRSDDVDDLRFAIKRKRTSDN